MRNKLACLLLMASLAVAQSKPTPKVAVAGFEITGKVVNAVTGEPVAEAEVGIGVPGKPEIMDGVTTGADGRFAFHNLAAGKYWLAAEHSRYPRQGYGQRERYSIGVAVGPKVLAEDVVFRVQPGASVTGTVTDEQNDPVRGAKAMLFHESLSAGARRTFFQGEMQTDDQGHYLFSHLLPGRYYVVVFAEPWYKRSELTATITLDGPSQRVRQYSEPQASGRTPFDVVYPITYYANAFDATSATPLDVKAGERATADLVLIPVPAIHLKLRCPGGCGLEPGVAVVSQPTFVGHTVPVARGTNPYRIEEASGGQDIAVPPGPSVISVGKGKELPIEPADGSEIDLRTAASAAEVSGRVMMEDGSTPKTAGIQFANGESNSNFPVSGGELSGIALKAGTYSVIAAGEADTQVKSISATGAKVNGHSIEVEEGAKVHLVIALTKGSVDVTGTALRDGKPMVGAMLLLVPEDVEHNEPLIRRDESDSDGTFLLRATLPGKYMLVAIENGWDLEWKKPEVLAPYLKAGQTVVVRAGGKYELKVAVQ